MRAGDIWKSRYGTKWLVIMRMEGDFGIVTLSGSSFCTLDVWQNEWDTAEVLRPFLQRNAIYLGNLSELEIQYA